MTNLFHLKSELTGPMIGALRSWPDLSKHVYQGSFRNSRGVLVSAATLNGLARRGLGSWKKLFKFTLNEAGKFAAVGIRNQTKDKNRDDCIWIRGYAAALGAIIRLHDEPTMARDVAQMDGLTVADFRKAGVEPYDLNPIRKAFKQ